MEHLLNVVIALTSGTLGTAVLTTPLKSVEAHKPRFDRILCYLPFHFGQRLFQLCKLEKKKQNFLKLKTEKTFFLRKKNYPSTWASAVCGRRWPADVGVCVWFCVFFLSFFLSFCSQVQKVSKIQKVLKVTFPKLRAEFSVLSF